MKKQSSKYYVAVATPLQQHSYRIAKAFVVSKMLDRYYTTVYNNKSLVYKILAIILPPDLAQKTIQKCYRPIDPYVKKYCELTGLLFLASGRVGFLKKRRWDISCKLNMRFGKKVARNCMKRNTDMLIMFDTLAESSFSVLKSKKVKTLCVLDMSSACVCTITQIISNEIDKGYSFTDSMIFKAKNYTMDKVENYQREIWLADYFLSPSEFVSNSLINIGVNANKIKYLPHGVDVSIFIPHTWGNMHERTLHFLFVGRVEAAKGIYYLAEAFKDERVRKRDVDLVVVGTLLTSINNFDFYLEKINLVGIKRSNEMPEVYSSADVFILSSLWEGSSLSMLEAMASGLPVIASMYSCAPEVVTDGEDGFVVEPRDVEELVKKIIWFDEHRNSIPIMSKNARQKIIENYTWEHYYSNLNTVAKEIFKERVSDDPVQ